MTVSKEKCKFLVKEIEYLGHKITQDGIFPKKDIISNLENASKPQDKDALRSFLGLGEYYAKFVKGYALVVEPLRQLLKKGARFIWTDVHDSAFQDVIKLIANAPGLKTFDPEGKIFCNCGCQRNWFGSCFHTDG
ncbi:uncharacterized protein LOC144784115 [Lissotriton helveticus]